MNVLYDSNCHPTITGRFLKKENASFADLKAELAATPLQGGAAVSIPGVADHGTPEEFLQATRQLPGFVAVAGIQVEELRPKLLSELKEMGYRGIKLHPRFSHEGFDSHQSSYRSVIEEAAKLDLVVYICTMTFGRYTECPTEDPLFQLVRLLKPLQRLPRMVLAHGGYLNLLRWSELARFNPEISLDLSYTLCYAQNSSLFQDMRFLCQRLDQKLLLGSDFPEFSVAEFARLAHSLTEGLDENKAANITHRNFLKLYGLST